MHLRCFVHAPYCMHIGRQEYFSPAQPLYCFIASVICVNPFLPIWVTSISIINNYVATSTAGDKIKEDKQNELCYQLLVLYQQPSIKWIYRCYQHIRWDEMLLWWILLKLERKTNTPDVVILTRCAAWKLLYWLIGS